MTEEQQQTLQRVVAQMDEVLRFQDETLAREDAREAEFKSERAGNKRALFAAMAMQGVLASNALTTPQDNADYGVKCADALIAALETPLTGSTAK